MDDSFLIFPRKYVLTFYVNIWGTGKRSPVVEGIRVVFNKDTPLVLIFDHVRLLLHTVLYLKSND